MSLWKELARAHLLGEGGEKRRVPYIHKPCELKALAESRDAGMRYHVAMSNYAVPEVLECMVCDESWPVRMAVAGNKNVTREQMELFLDDEEKPVRYMARTCLPHKPWLYRAILARTVKDVETQRLFVEDSDEMVRTAVGANEHLVEYLFFILCRDADEAVRGAIAGNPSLPPPPNPLRSWLLSDRSKYVQERAESNRSFRKKVLVCSEVSSFKGGHHVAVHERGLLQCRP